MGRLGVVSAAVALVLLAPLASAELPDLRSLDAALEDASTEVQELRTVAEETAFEAAGAAGHDLGGEPLVAPADAWDLDLDPMFAVVLGLAAAAALGVVGGARFVTPAEVLENPVRQRIFAHLRARTGATLKQVTEDLALTTTNAIWHLRKLEDAGLVHSRRFNGYKVFYPAEGGVHARRLSLSMTALANGNAQEVFEYVLANPGTHQREIARALNVNHGTVRWHLKKLRGAELLAEERRGKTSTYVATDVGREALANVRPAPQPVAAVIAATPVQ